MARYTGAVCRLCRREGEKLFLKGERCLTDKCPVTRRGTAPGQHGAAQSRKNKEYNMQLREKQKAKRYYGVAEKQFRNYFEVASKAKDKIISARKRGKKARFFVVFPHCVQCAEWLNWCFVW